MPTHLSSACIVLYIKLRLLIPATEAFLNEQGRPDVLENKYHGQQPWINDRISLALYSLLNCDNGEFYAVLTSKELPKYTGPPAHNNPLGTAVPSSMSHFSISFYMGLRIFFR